MARTPSKYICDNHMYFVAMQKGDNIYYLGPYKSLATAKGVRTNSCNRNFTTWIEVADMSEGVEVEGTRQAPKHDG